MDKQNIKPCEHWAEIENEIYTSGYSYEYCKLVYVSCMCGADKKECTFEYALRKKENDNRKAGNKRKDTTDQ